MPVRRRIEEPAGRKETLKADIVTKLWRREQDRIHTHTRLFREAETDCKGRGKVI